MLVQRWSTVYGVGPTLNQRVVSVDYMCQVASQPVECSGELKHNLSIGQSTHCVTVR